LYKSLNEVHIIEHDEFLQMAPAITQLEISRLSELLTNLEPGSDIYTTLVSVRYHLSLFLEELEKHGEPGTDELNAAIMCLVMPDEGDDETIRDTMIYVSDRLGYILAQMNRLR